MKARIWPSASLAATIALPAWWAPRNESIAIEKPRSGAPLRQLSDTRSSSSIVPSSRRSWSISSARYPAADARDTDCRTFRIERPSSENDWVSTIASSPR